MKWTNPDQKMKLATVDIPQKAAYLYFSNFPQILFNFLFVITEIGSLTSNLIHCKACFWQELDSLYTPRHVVPLWHEARLVSSPAHIGIARACLPACSVFGQTPHESQESRETSTPILILFSTWPPCFMSTLNFWAISPFQIPAPSQETAGISVAQHLMPKSSHRKPEKGKFSDFGTETVATLTRIRSRLWERKDKLWGQQQLPSCRAGALNQQHPSLLAAAR